MKIKKSSYVHKIDRSKCINKTGAPSPLTVDDIRLIRLLWRDHVKQKQLAHQTTLKALAEKFDTNYNSIWLIVTYQTFRWVRDKEPT